MLLSVFLLYLIGSAVAVRQSVEHFSGRSANIVIQTSDDAGHSAILLHGDQFNNNDLKSIEESRVADLLAHVMGTQPFNTITNRKDFPKGDMFNKAKAALLFTLDSVSPAFFESSLGDYQRVDLTTISYPTNTLSLATSIASGTSPSSHGIVGGQWITANGDKVKAYEGTSGASLSANIADILSQEWSGASLTVSASASAPLAAVFAVNKRLAGANSYGFVLKNGASEGIYSKTAGPLSLTDSACQSIIESALFSKLLGAKYENKQFSFTAGTAPVVFDLESEVDAPLFTELAFVYNFFQVLESDPSLASLVADQTPDFFAFSFSSLKAIKEKYGEQSATLDAAVLFTSDLIKYAVAKMDSLYGGRAVAVVASLNSNTATSAATKAATLSVARKYMSPADFELYYPSLYVTPAEAGQLCSELKSTVEDQSVTVNCFTSTYYNDVYAAPSNITGNHTALNVPEFWIILWITVVLIIFIMSGIFLLVASGVEASKDSLLFRSTGRHLHQS